MVVAISAALLAALLCSPIAAGAGLQAGSRDEVLKSAALIAEDLVDLYNGEDSSGIPGVLPEPYYWFQSGLLMGSFIDYWRLSGDDQFNDVVKEAMAFQASETENFMPENQTMSMGNDDQCLWALSALLAAENDFPSPPKGTPQWLDLAKNTFNDMKARLDNERESGPCDGGLRWQVFSFNAGFNYKNTLSNGCLFDLGARLAKVTDDSTYSKIAEEQWDWLDTIGLIDSKNKAVYDGVSIEDDECGEPEKIGYSSNAAILAHGAAYMYNHTEGSDTWRERVELMTDILLTNFFPKDGILAESLCESEVCTPDQIALRAFTARTLTHIVEMAPFLGDKVNPAIKATGEAAAEHCTRVDSDEPCGFVWTDDEYLVSNSSGVGEQMNALAAISNLLSLFPGETGKSGSDKPSGNESAEESADNNDGSSTDPSGQTPTGAGDPPAESTEPSGAARNAISGMLGLVLVSAITLLSL